MTKPRVGVVRGSASYWDVMRHAVEPLENFGIPHEVQVVSAHRTPDLLFEYAVQAEPRGHACIIAGGTVHLPGMLAAKTVVPVLGVPVPSKYLKGMDSLLSIVQMPKGVPVSTFAIGEPGAANTGLFAAELLALHDGEIAQRLRAFRQTRAEAAIGMKLHLPA